MDQTDIAYDDFIDKNQKSKPKPPLRLLILALLIVLVAAGGYGLWSRPEILSSLAHMLPAVPNQEALAPEPTQEVSSAEMSAVVATDLPQQPTAAVSLPTEVPEVVVDETILPAPEFGWLLQTSSNADDDLSERATKIAIDLAVREPYQWEYLEFDQETLVRDVESYYIDLLNKEMGYLLTFNDRYPDSALAIFKFKQNGRRVTINYYEAQKTQSPTAFLFYEGW